MQRFVKDYLETGNATEAAARNYKTKSRQVAGQIGWENLKKPEIQEMLANVGLNAISRIEEMSQKAKSEHVKFQANKDLADRGGFKPTEHIHIHEDEPTEEEIEDVIAGIVAKRKKRSVGGGKKAGNHKKK